MTLDKIKPYAKAVAGFIVPFAGAILTAVSESSPGGDAIIRAEWISAVALAITTGGAVFTIPNRDPKAKHQDESVQPPHAGDEDTTYDGMGAPISNPDPLDAPNEDYAPRHIMRHDK